MVDGNDSITSDIALENHSIQEVGGGLDTARIPASLKNKSTPTLPTLDFFSN